MKLKDKSYFDIIKEKKTCKTFFGEFRRMSERTHYRTEGASRVVLEEIAKHCPSYQFILTEEVFVRVSGRSSPFLSTQDIHDIHKLILNSSGIQKKFIETFRLSIVPSHEMAVVWDRLLASIDDQAYVLCIDFEQFRADILPYLKLSLAYAEST